MSHQDQLSAWTTSVSTNLPHRSKPQATGLALWSFGIVCTRSCGHGTVATLLALLLNQKRAAVEQRLYDGCLDASDKAGGKQQALDVTTCFVPLLRWMVRLWRSTQRARTIDASSLGDRFTQRVPDAGRQRGLAWLRHSSRLDDPARGAAARLPPGVVAHAAAAASSHSA